MVEKYKHYIILSHYNEEILVDILIKNTNVYPS